MKGLARGLQPVAAEPGIVGRCRPSVTAQGPWWPVVAQATLPGPSHRPRIFLTVGGSERTSLWKPR